MSEASSGGVGPIRVQRGTTATRVGAILGLVVLIGMASLPGWGDAGTLKLLIDFFTLLALAQMWNLLAGYAGLISIGQQAFIGLGAYGFYLFADLQGWPPLLAIAGVAVVVGVIALLTSLFVFRLEGGYFAVGTWVIAEVFRLIVTQNQPLGAGTGVSIQSLAPLGPSGRISLTYWLALGVGAGSILFVAMVMRSRLGLALRAIRDSEAGAQSLGVDIFRSKLVVYLIASIGCGVVGAVVYMNLLRIQPDAAFGVDWTARMIFIVIIGGLGSIEGPVIGALIYFGLRQGLSDYGSAYLIVLGVVAVVVTMFVPRGIWGLIERRLPLNLFGIQRRLIEPPGSGPAGPGRT